MNSKKQDSDDRRRSGPDPRESYYRADDEPTSEEKASMWTAAARGLPGANSPERGTALHWRSFWLGQAAAVLLLLAVFGGYTLWQDLGGGSSPDTPLQRTYRSSLKEMASSAQFLSPPSGEQQREVLDSQLRGLEEIDRMIEEMRSDMLLNGSTQAKRQQLRRLYATKLDFVQKLILTEEASS